MLLFDFRSALLISKWTNRNNHIKGYHYVKIQSRPEISRTSNLIELATRNAPSSSGHCVFAITLILQRVVRPLIFPHCTCVWLTAENKLLTPRAIFLFTVILLSTRRWTKVDNLKSGNFARIFKEGGFLRFCKNFVRLIFDVISVWELLFD